MRGYTLIETLLVIAIVITVGFFSAAFSSLMIPRMAVRDAGDQLKSVLRKAENYTISGRLDSSWGVHYADSVITLFKGASYAGREDSFDERTGINERISVSGFTEVVFVRPGGRPAEALPDVMLGWGNEETNFSLNAEGAIE
jgi:Tfp pilus assembly protein FimT